MYGNSIFYYYDWPFCGRDKGVVDKMNAQAVAWLLLFTLILIQILQQLKIQGLQHRVKELEKKVRVKK